MSGAGVVPKPIHLDSQLEKALLYGSVGIRVQLDSGRRFEPQDRKRLRDGVRKIAARSACWIGTELLFQNMSGSRLVQFLARSN